MSNAPTQPSSSCAYCQKTATSTKEHLWPASLHRRLYAENNQTANAFWLARLQKEIPSEPQIRDVCAHCNNVVLSELDSYICDLFDSTLVRMPERHERITFRYDYHLLKRWLLKMCFNSARIHDSIDRFALEALRPYMLGVDQTLGRSVQLFLQLAYSQEVSARELNPESTSDEITIVEPTIHRVGHMQFHAEGIGKKVLRAVHLRSYSFYLAFWPPKGARAEQDHFESVFTSCMDATRLLRPSIGAVELVCDGMGAWDSYRESRGGRFVAGDGG